MQPSAESIRATLQAARDEKKWVGASGQTFEQLPDGFLLVNGTTYVCCIDGGGPVDWDHAGRRHS